MLSLDVRVCLWVGNDKSPVAAGIVLGSPLVAIFYSGYERDIQGTIIIPVTLYQVMQVGCAQLLTSLLKKWVAEDKKQDGENDKSADTG